MNITIKHLNDEKNIHRPPTRAFKLELIADIGSVFPIKKNKETPLWQDVFLKKYLKKLLSNKALSRKQLLEEKQYIIALLGSSECL